MLEDVGTPLQQRRPHWYVVNGAFFVWFVVAWLWGLMAVTSIQPLSTPTFAFLGTSFVFGVGAFLGLFAARRLTTQRFVMLSLAVTTTLLAGWALVVVHATAPPRLSAADWAAAWDMAAFCVAAVVALLFAIRDIDNSLRGQGQPLLYVTIG